MQRSAFLDAVRADVQRHGDRWAHEYIKNRLLSATTGAVRLRLPHEGPLWSDALSILYSVPRNRSARIWLSTIALAAVAHDGKWRTAIAVAAALRLESPSRSPRLGDSLLRACYRSVDCPRHAIESVMRLFPVRLERVPFVLRDMGGSTRLARWSDALELAAQFRAGGDGCNLNRCSVALASALAADPAGAPLAVSKLLIEELSRLGADTTTVEHIVATAQSTGSSRQLCSLMHRELRAGCWSGAVAAFVTQRCHIVDDVELVCLSRFVHAAAQGSSWCSAVTAYAVAMSMCSPHRHAAKTLVMSEVAQSLCRSGEVSVAQRSLQVLDEMADCAPWVEGARERRGHIEFATIVAARALLRHGDATGADCVLSTTVRLQGGRDPQTPFFIGEAGIEPLLWRAVARLRATLAVSWTHALAAAAGFDALGCDDDCVPHPAILEARQQKALIRFSVV